MNYPLIELAREEIKEKYPSFTFPKKSYLILYSARSGSNLLSRYLEKAGLGIPREAFNPNTSNRERLAWGINYEDPAEYIQTAIEKQTSNDVMGMKISIPVFKLFMTTTRSLFSYTDLNDSEVIETIFPNVKYIHIQRKNKVKQAISFSKAKQNGVWIEEVGADTSYRNYVTPAVYDREHIEYCFDELLMEDVALNHFLKIHQLPSILLWYEELANNPQKTLNEVYDLLEVKGKEITKAPLRRQSNLISKDWESRFYEETSWLNNKAINQALDSGDLDSLFIARSLIITSEREENRFLKMPSTRFKWFRKWFTRGRRKLKRILNISKTK